MRFAGTVWLQVLVSIAMFAFISMALRPELAEAASRKQGREHSASLTGRWAWRTNCPRGQYRGAAFIAQHSVNRFSGQLGNTSFYDRGTISGRNHLVRLNLLLIPADEREPGLSALWPPSHKLVGHQCV